MPNTRPRVVFDENGVCNACNYAETMKNKIIDWQERENELRALLDVHRRDDGYWDCIIPWSGGKDSTANAIKLKTEYNMNPLLVTFNPLIPTEVGEHNRRILLEYYCMTGKEVSDLFKNGMDAEEFKNRFGHDAMAQQVIAFYKSEVCDGRK